MKHIQKLNEIAASNTTKTLQPVHIVPAEPESAEQQLGFTAEEAALLEDINNFTEAVKATEDMLLQNLMDGAASPQSEQSPESAQLDQLAASVGSTRVAVIPAVDQPADHQPNRGPVDVLVGTSRIKNPG